MTFVVGIQGHFGLNCTVVSRYGALLVISTGGLCSTRTPANCARKQLGHEKPVIALNRSNIELFDLHFSWYFYQMIWAFADAARLFWSVKSILFIDHALHNRSRP
jgi:hypothetical protein